MDLRTRLTEIIEKGGAQQADHARTLLQRLDRSGDESALADEAAVLYDAYLHDPYLTRQDG